MNLNIYLYHIDIPFLVAYLFCFGFTAHALSKPHSGSSTHSSHSCLKLEYPTTWSYC